MRLEEERAVNVTMKGRNGHRGRRNFHVPSNRKILTFVVKVMSRLVTFTVLASDKTDAVELMADSGNNGSN